MDSPPSEHMSQAHQSGSWFTVMLAKHTRDLHQNEDVYTVRPSGYAAHTHAGTAARPEACQQEHPETEKGM